MLEKVSIIIPCYNQEKFIGDCIKSCVEQTVLPHEIRVVDDGSKDESCTIVSQWEFPSKGMIQLVYAFENRGVSHVRNRGLSKTTGDFIVLLDGDDMLTPKSIEHRLKAFRDNPKLDVVHGRARKCHGNISYNECLKKQKKLEVYTRPPQFKAINFQTVMYRRRVFEKYGLFYEGLRSKEDKEFITRLGLHRDSPWSPLVKCKRIDKDIAFYRRHPESKHKKRIADKAWSRETERIFAKRIRQLKAEGITKENTPWL